MFPIFKSHYSIGKSILTLDPPKDPPPEGSDPPHEGPDSVFDIAKSLNLNEVVLIEDSFMGFLQAQKVSESLGINFIFGLRISIIEKGFDPEVKKHPKHKVVVFAKNSEGCKILFKIYSLVKSTDINSITLCQLSELWSTDHLDLAVPFYDSFLFCNLFLFNSFVVDLKSFNPTFLIEKNGLPFDPILESSIHKYSEVNSYPTALCKSIFYKNREDYDAFITYKLICSRNSFASSKSSLEKPNMDHMGSREFCYESYLENINLSK